MYECDSLNWSESQSVLTAVTPSRPLNLRFDPTIRYKNSLIYRWDMPTSNGGSPLQDYTLEILDVVKSTKVDHVVTIQAKLYRFELLDSARDYSVRMKVRNLIDESDWTDPVEARTGIVPTRPGILTFDATTRTTISLSFDELVGSDTGGTDTNPLEITFYHIYIDNGINGDFTLLKSLAGTEDSFTVQFLVPNLVYRFKYQAENSIGLLSQFSTEQSMPAGSFPSAPGAPRLLSESNEMIYFDWDLSFDNGGS